MPSNWLKQFSDRRLMLLILFITPFLFFARHFHLEILNPANFYWLLTHDWGQHAVGQRALWSSEWSFPLTRAELIYPPIGAETALMDANPLLSLALKPFAPLFPNNFQVIGLWFLLMVYLQAWAGYLLIQRYASTRCLAAFAALVFLLWPAFWGRMDHDTLMAQWLILLGLWMFITPASPRTRLLRFSILLMLAASIHATLFLICAAIWSAEVLRTFWSSLKRRSTWIHLGLISTIPPAAAILLFFLIGTLPGGGERSWGFGEYSLNLNAPFNSVYDWGSVLFLHFPMHERQRFEGYAYFGAGLFLLFVLTLALKALGARTNTLSDKRSQPDSVSLNWLWLPMIGCGLISLSTTVRLGETILLDIPLSNEMRDGTLGAVRSSGRFFWPIAYLLIFLALKRLLQLRLPYVLATLGLVFSLQIVDLHLFSSVHRLKTQSAVTQTHFQRTPSPDWEEIFKETKSVVFIPPRMPDDYGLLYELAWRALGNKASINTMYMSRRDPRHNDPSQAPIIELATDGPQPRTLYVYPQGCTGAAKHRTDLYRIDDILIRPPSSSLVALTGYDKEICR